MVENDLTPEAQQGFADDLPRPVESVEVEQSTAPVFSPFDEEPKEEVAAAELFLEDGSPPPASLPATKQPTLTQMLAISMADMGTLNPLTVSSLENLALASNVIDNQQDFAARLQIASRRTQEEALFLGNLKEQMQRNVRTPVSEEAISMIDTAYQARLITNNNDRAQLALEQETVERTEDFLTNGDAHEAAVALDRYANGTAEDRIRDNRVKDLIIMQRLEELEGEYEDSGWLRGFFNGFMRIIPFKENADASNITFDAGLGEETSWMDFFFGRGDDYLKQGEAIYDLSPEKFAEFMAKDGPFMSSLKENAGMFINDPTKQLEMMNDIFAQSKDDQSTNNAWATFDTVLSVPIVTGTKFLLGAGARKAATNNMARAITASATEGETAARALTGVSGKEAAEAMSPKAFVPNRVDVGMGPDVTASLRAAEELAEELPRIIGTSRFTNPEELGAAFQAAEKAAVREYGKHLKDVNYLEVNVDTGTALKWQGDLVEGGRNVHRLEVMIGKVDGGGYSAAKTAKNTAVNKFGVSREAVETVKDSSGQYFAKFQVVVKEEGFVTSPLKGNDTSFLRFFRSSDRIADKTGVSKALVGGNAANLFNTAMTRALRAAVKGISKRDKNAVDQIIRKGQNEGTWFSRDEFVMNFQRLNNNAIPADKVIDMYNTYRRVSDLAYVMRNRNVYMAKHGEGYESMRLPFGGRTVDIDGIKMVNPTARPAKGRIFDSSANRPLPKDADIGEMSLRDYVMVKFDDVLEAPNGAGYTHAMVKRGDLQTRPLRVTQLPYSMGGSRAYSAKYFVKQARHDVLGSLMNPNVFIAGKNRNEMAIWTEKMNEALDYVKVNPSAADEARLDDILSAVDGTPTGREFLELVDARKIDLNNKLRVVYDREMPSEYFGKTGPELALVNAQEDAITGYNRSHGRMYYSSKGEHLRDYTGDFAQTIDPWQSLNASLTEVARGTSLAGYKSNMAARFKDSYGSFVEGQNRSLYDLVNAPIKTGVDKRLKDTIRNEQIAMERILRYESGWEKNMKNTNRMVSEWVLGSGRAGGFREKAYDWTLAIQENNPVEFLRGLAFDANLGVFNLGQLFIQTSTMASAVALSPKAGFKGVAISTPLFQWRLSGYSDNVLDLMAKRGMHKGGFDTEEEFKAFARMFRNSGVDEVGGATLANLREYGTSSVFGAASKFDALREKGRMFFYQAERFNRTTAARIAWDELAEAGVKPGTSGFREEFLRLTNDYSMSMMSETSAGFQHGLASIPTQFWGYSFRMMEAMVGKRFTPAQKARLVVANGLMAGTAGVPAGFLIEDIMERYNGEPTSIEGIDGWIERGVIDGLVHVATGADVRIGDKVGTADLIPNAILDIFSMGQFGDKSTAEILAGATGSKVGSAVPVLWDAIRYSASEAGGEDLNGLSEEAWLRLARELQTVNFAHNAYMANQYGIFQSKSGIIVDSNVPEADAFFYALGFNPAAMDDASFYMEQSKDQTERIKDAANQVSKWRQEAFTTPDKFEENREKVAAFMGLFDPSERAAILKKANSPKDKDFEDSVRRRWEEAQAEAETMNTLTGAVEDAE